jgi:putative ABC transport system permease protein
MIVWKIALRNLREHKRKTIIVGVLIAVAMTVLVAGNSLMDSVTKKMEAGYRESFTGDVVVHTQSTYGISLFGVQGLDRLNTSVPALQNPEAVREILTGSGAGEWTGIVQAQGLYLHNEEQSGVATLWGIEPGAYLSMFDDGITILAGSAFADSERGMLLSAEAARQLQQTTGVRYEPGDAIRISGTSQAGGSRIREVSITGIFEFSQRNPQLSMVSLVDLATARELAGLDVRPVTVADLSAAEQQLLGAVSEDQLFGAGAPLGDPAETPRAGGAPAPVTDAKLVLGDSGRADRSSTFDLDQWHFIIATAAPARSAGRLERELQRELADVPGTTVSDWQWAAGATITLVVSLQIIFNAVALIVSIVSIIIIVNTLVISVSERIPEIGTIRAIGGKKRFVRKLITRETLAITGAFGLAGMIAGAITVAAIGALGIQADTRFLQILLGGEVFRPAISASAIISSLAGVGAMAWIASLYPVRMATKISPIAAMQRG